MTDAELQQALANYDNMLSSLNQAIEQLRELRNKGTLDSDYANAQISALRDARGDIEDIVASLDATTPVSTVPSEAQTNKLADAVKKLHEQNVAAEAAKGALDDIASIVEATNKSKPKSMPALAKSLAGQTGNLSHLEVGLIAFAALVAGLYLGSRRS